MKNFELREKALHLVQEARAKLNEGGAEAEAQADAMLGEADALEARAAKLDSIEAREAAYSEADARRPTENRSINGNAELSNEERHAQAYEAYMRTGEVRAQTVGTPSEGGYLVPTTMGNQIIKSMKWFGPVYNDDVTFRLNTSSGEAITYPTFDDTANSGATIAEAGTHGQAAVAFGQKTLNAYRVSSGVFKVSRELLSDNAFDITGLLSEAMGERLGRKANSLLTVGSGTSTPQGIVTAVGTPTLATAAANLIGGDDILELIHSVDVAYRSNGSFMVHDTNVLRLRKLKDSEGRYVWQDGYGANQPTTLFGYKVQINNDMVATVANNVVPIIFGDMKKYFVRQVGGVYMARLNELYAVTGEVGFVAELRLDGRLMDAAAVKGLKVLSA